jgi:hypothetical protein
MQEMTDSTAECPNQLFDTMQIIAGKVDNDLGSYLGDTFSKSTSLFFRRSIE